MASDTDGGSKTVKVSGKEVMLKDKSCFKKSTGNEAGNAPKKGILTSTNKGKMYFTSWSMDVKVENQNAVRHLDMVTYNHSSKPGNGATWPYLDKMYMSAAQAAKCEKDKKKEEDACGPCKKKKAAKTKAAECKSKACKNARKCMLTPYKPNKCCKGQTGHHLVEVHSFCEKGARGTPLKDFPKYDMNKAPVVCAACRKGSRYDKEHGRLHAFQGTMELDAMAKAKNPAQAWKFKDAKAAGVKAHQATFPEAECDPGCIEAQLKASHKKMGITENSPARTETPPLKDWQRDWGRKAVEEASKDAKKAFSTF
jgi:hypothetical protein